MHGYFTYFFYLEKQRYGVDNILPFILGFCFSGIRKYTDKYIMKYDFSYFGKFPIFEITFPFIGI